MVRSWPQRSKEAASASVLPASVAVGVLATITMDAWFVAAARLGGEALTSDKVGPDLVGRWAGGLARGEWRHRDIAAAPAHEGRGGGRDGHPLCDRSGPCLRLPGGVAPPRSSAGGGQRYGLRGRHGPAASSDHVPVVGLRLLRPALRRRRAHGAGHAHGPRGVWRRYRSAGARCSRGASATGSRVFRRNRISSLVLPGQDCPVARRTWRLTGQCAPGARRARLHVRRQP